jgi:hypothetical protein
MPIPVDTYLHKTADVQDPSDEELRAELEKLRQENVEPSTPLSPEELTDNEIKERLHKGQCVMCGEELEPDKQAMEETGYELYPPTCPVCSQKPIPEHVKKYIEEEKEYYDAVYGEDYSPLEEELKNPTMEFYEEPTDPKKMEEEYMPTGFQRLEADILKKLVKLADDLDQKGLYGEADIISNIIRTAKKGVPPHQYKKLKECIEKDMSFKECAEEVSGLTQENYREIKQEMRRCEGPGKKKRKGQEKK